MPGSPSPPFRFGIRQKMVAVLLTVLTIALATTGWITFREQQAEIYTETKKRGDDISRFMSRSLALSVVGYDYHSIQLILDEIVRSEDIVYARVLSAKGNSMAFAGVKPRISEGANTARIAFDRDIVFDGKTVGKLFFFMNNERIVRRLEARKNDLIVREFFIVILVAIGEFLALSFIIARPVSIISKSMTQDIGEDGILSQDITLKSNDEFGVLAERFNTMRRQMNLVNIRLKSRVDLADEELQKKNDQLLGQSKDLKKLSKELEYLSVTDPLTGIYNRRYFDTGIRTELSMTIRYGEPTSLLLIDIDDFKELNEIHGHDAGDRVLCDLAALLPGNLREADTLCRVGGGKMAVICRRTGKEDSLVLAEKIRHMIETHVFSKENGAPLKVTASIGVQTATKKGPVKNIEVFSKSANKALYFCKKAGRNLARHFDDLPYSEKA